MFAQVFQDQLGRNISLNKIPERIVSLVPSQTELLFDLGLENRVVGRTKFCIHPALKVGTSGIVGGTKNIHPDRIRALEPDLIIANKEENDKAQIEALAKEFPVWISDIHTFSDALDMILALSRLTGTRAAGQKLLEGLQNKHRDWQQIRQALPPLRVAYLIWQEPLMVAGNDTFINYMLQEAGFVNVFEDLARYPEVSVQVLAERQADCIFLSSEPYPFREKHLDFFSKLCPQSKIMLVDGELFSWYGSRLWHSFDYFAKLRRAIPC